MAVVLTKAQMEERWNAHDVAQPAALCRWIGGQAESGTACSFEPSAAVKKFRAKAYGGKGYPAWSKSQPPCDIELSKELKARYRADCPHNAAALIAAFGKTRTKYDAPEDYYTPNEQIPIFSSLPVPGEATSRSSSCKRPICWTVQAAIR